MFVCPNANAIAGTVLGYIATLYRNIGRHLILTPNTTSLYQAWLAEIKSCYPRFMAVTMHFTADLTLSQRNDLVGELLLRKDVILLVPTSMLRRLLVMMTEHEQAHSTYRWASVVVDEGHRLKDPTTNLVIDVANLQKQTKCIWVLTGTHVLCIYAINERRYI